MTQNTKKVLKMRDEQADVMMIELIKASKELGQNENEHSEERFNIARNKFVVYLNSNLIF
jgi:hypothetical protein